MNEKGFSLPVAFGLIVILGLLCMVSLAMMISDSALTGGLYSRTVTLNTAESGIHQAAPILLDEAATNFTTVLQDQAGDVLHGQINYAAFGDAFFDVTMRDNDDLDGDLNVDTDKRVIINGVGHLNSGGRTELEVLLQYIGSDDEYAQETGGSRSTSNYGSEFDVSGLNLSAVGEP